MALDVFKGEESIIVRDNSRTTHIYYEFTIDRAALVPQIKVASSGGAAGVSTLFVGGIPADILQEILTFLNTPIIEMTETYGVD